MILMSFDDAEARASYFLRLFPLKPRRRNCECPQVENLIHVEVLQNSDTDTYAVLTSARIILIRLTKGGSGPLSPMLCWQVQVFAGTDVSSNVTDHGHNGSALTISVKRGPFTENDVDLDRNSFSYSSDMAIPPDQLPAAIGHHRDTEQFDRGTDKGSRGEVIEWFTVVTEFQYRRQLAKFHNAISCVAGNLDDIINDPSVGKPGSTQSYTSFGIYHFAKKRDEDDGGNMYPPTTAKDSYNTFLDELPWRFEILENPVGDPQWLVAARQRALAATLETPLGEADKSPQEPSSPSNSSPSGRVRKVARWLSNRWPSTASLTDEEKRPRNGRRRSSKKFEAGKLAGPISKINPDSGSCQSAESPRTKLRRRGSLDSDGFEKHRSRAIAPKTNGGAVSKSARSPYAEPTRVGAFVRDRLEKHEQAMAKSFEAGSCESAKSLRAREPRAESVDSDSIGEHRSIPKASSKRRTELVVGESAGRTRRESASSCSSKESFATANEIDTGNEIPTPGVKTTGTGLEVHLQSDSLRAEAESVGPNSHGQSSRIEPPALIGFELGHGGSGQSYLSSLSISAHRDMSVNDSGDSEDDINVKTQDEVIAGSQQPYKASLQSHLKRMEQRLDQLLPFLSSEQASHDGSESTPRPSILENQTRSTELQELRLQLEQQRRAESAAQAEIARLRHELSKLTELVTEKGDLFVSTPIQSSDIASHPNEE
ncbi:hypothetical protein ACA910_017346 [Epithemia clementina (nom. ined.)]